MFLSIFLISTKYEYEILKKRPCVNTVKKEPIQDVIILIESKGALPEKIQEILKDLESELPEIEASAVVSAEGFPMASALPKDIDELRVAAITAVMLNMGERATMEFSKGTLQQVIVKGSDGLLISMAAGSDAVLTVSATHDARLGMLLLYSERTAQKIRNLLTENH